MIGQMVGTPGGGSGGGAAQDKAITDKDLPAMNARLKENGISVVITLPPAPARVP